MPRGLPDYYNPSSIVSQRMVDLAGAISAAAKIPPLDGRGRLAFFDSFSEGPYAFSINLYGNATLAGLDTVIAEVPPASLLVHPGTLAGGGQVAINRYFYADNPTLMGLEAGWSVGLGSVWVSHIIIGDFNGTYWTSQLIFETGTGLFRIMIPGGSQTLATLRTINQGSEWLQMKLVVDFTTGKYVRAIFGQTQFDISAYSLRSQASSVDGRTISTVDFIAANNVVADARLGHVAITLDEP